MTKEYLFQLTRKNKQTTAEGVTAHALKWT